MSTISTTISNLTASTFDNRRAGLANSIFRFYPFFTLLSEKGRLDTMTGGQYAEYPIQMAKNTTTRFIGRGGSVPLDDTEFMEVARYSWSTMATNVTSYFYDSRINRGKGKILDIVSKKVDNAMQSIADQCEEALADNPPAGPTPLTPITDIVKSASTTSGTTGGLTRNATYWYNQATSLTGLSHSVYMIPYLRTLMNTCSIVGEGIKRLPDILLTNQTVYEYYEDELMEVNIITNKAIDDLGFGGGIKFKQATLVWSPCFSSLNSIFVLNSNNIKVQIDPIANLKMTPWKDIPNQPFDKVAQIVLVCQLGCDCLVNQGVLHTIDT